MELCVSTLCECLTFGHARRLTPPPPPPSTVAFLHMRLKKWPTENFSLFSKFCSCDWYDHSKLGIQVFGCPVFRSPLYFEDPKTGHLNTGFILKPDILVFSSYHLKTRQKCPFFNAKKLETRTKMSSFCMPFENQTIWELAYFRPFRNQSCPVFGFPLYRIADLTRLKG